MPYVKENSASNTASSSNSTSQVCTITSPTSGRLLTAVWSSNTDTNPTSITGGGVTTWATAVNHTDGVRRIVIYYGIVDTTPTTSVTVNYAKLSAARWLAVDEWSGNASSSVLDVTATGSGTGTALSTGSNTPTVAGVALVAGTYHSSNAAPTASGGGFTAHADFGATDDVFLAHYKIATSIQAEECTLTFASSSGWRACWAAFKPAATTGGIVVNGRSRMASHLAM